jgi:hypothetical protein
MMLATAKKRTAKTIIPWLVLFLVAALVPVLLTTGCSRASGSTTTTTGESTTTSTTEAVDTSTTSTTEKITTTTTTEFPPTANHDQTDSRLVFSGKWDSVKASSAQGGSLMVANTKGASVTVRFYGTACSWIAKKSSAYGQATVKVDDAAAKTIDLYSSKTTWKSKVWTSGKLDLGDHTVVISWTGKKSSKATATNINVDAITTTGILTGVYEQDNKKLSYEDTWKTTTNSAASGGSFKYSDAASGSVTVQFTGLRLIWLARTAADCGQASVTIDGNKSSTVDLYSSATKSKQKVWDSGALEYGKHTVKITWLGTKNSKATGTAINVDGFQVTGSLD